MSRLRDGAKITTGTLDKVRAYLTEHRPASPSAQSRPLPVAKPLNVVVGMLEPGITAEQLGRAGVKRISVGGALSRLALAHFVKGAREMKEQGSFGWMAEAIAIKELQKYFG